MEGDFYLDQMHRDDYKLLLILAMLIHLTRSTILLLLENALKSSSSLPRDFRQMSKTDQFFNPIRPGLFWFFKGLGGGRFAPTL